MNKTLFFFSISQLVDSRLHIASSVKVWYKEFFYWIYGIRSALFIVDLVKSISGIKRSLLIIEKFSFFNLGVCFVINNKFISVRLSRELEKYLKFSFSYFTKQWLPGFLTNFRVFNINLLPRIRKYARVTVFDRQRLFKPRWKFFYEVVKGLRETFEIPSLVCFLTVRHNEFAVNESYKMLIPTVGLADTDIACLSKLTFIIPGNDDSTGSLLFLFIAFKNAFIIGLLRKRRFFLFLISSVLNFFRKKNIHIIFDKFLYVYFFLGNLFALLA